MKWIIAMIAFLSVLSFGFMGGLYYAEGAMRVVRSGQEYSVEKEGDSFHLLHAGETVMWVSVGDLGYVVENYADKGLVFRGRFERESGFDMIEMVRVVEEGAGEVVVFYDFNGGVERRLPMDQLGPEAWR